MGFFFGMSADGGGDLGGGHRVDLAAAALHGSSTTTSAKGLAVADGPSMGGWCSISAHRRPSGLVGGAGAVDEGAAGEVNFGAGGADEEPSRGDREQMGPQEQQESRGASPRREPMERGASERMMGQPRDL